jgi:hypothetical protein
MNKKDLSERDLCSKFIGPPSSARDGISPVREVVVKVEALSNSLSRLYPEKCGWRQTNQKGWFAGATTATSARPTRSFQRER